MLRRIMHSTATAIHNRPSRKLSRFMNGYQRVEQACLGWPLLGRVKSNLKRLVSAKIILIVRTIHHETWNRVDGQQASTVVRRTQKPCFRAKHYSVDGYWIAAAHKTHLFPRAAPDITAIFKASQGRSLGTRAARVHQSGFSLGILPRNSGRTFDVVQYGGACVGLALVMARSEGTPARQSASAGVKEA